MAYYNYHAQVTQKIKNGELISYYFDNNYNKIGFCLVLCFIDKKYPIRESNFDDYFNLIGEYYSTQKIDDIFCTKFLRT